MKNKKTKWIIVAVLMLLMIGGTIGGVSYAKYKGQVMVTGTVNYYNRLAETFSLKEHELKTEQDGAQTLDTGESGHNRYMLIPGTVLEQDPFFEIAGRSSLDAMLFMELTGDPIGVNVKDYWQKLDGVSGPEHGDVYVYTGDINDGQTSYQIPIFDQGEALSEYPSEIDAGRGGFVAVGYLVQVNDSAMTPAELFEARFN